MTSVDTHPDKQRDKDTDASILEAETDAVVAAALTHKIDWHLLPILTLLYLLSFLDRWALSSD
jgi:hypothetical protein